MSTHPPIKIRRQNRRSMMMRPVPDAIEVYIPHWMPENAPEVQRFIAEGLKQLQPHFIESPATQTSESEVRRMLSTWSARMGVKATRVQFRQMYGKWGSCSSKGTLTLNRAMFWLPPDLAEYVVVHELAHLREMNHGAGWRALMSQHLPDWEARHRRMDGQYSTFGACPTED